MTITIYHIDTPGGYRAVTYDNGGQKVAGEGETIPAALRTLADYIQAIGFTAADVVDERNC